MVKEDGEGGREREMYGGVRSVRKVFGNHMDLWRKKAGELVFSPSSHCKRCLCVRVTLCVSLQVSILSFSPVSVRREPDSLCALFLPFDPVWQIVSCFALALWQEVALQAPRRRRSAAEDSGKRVGDCRQREQARASFTSPTLLLPPHLLHHHHHAVVGQYEPQLWFLHTTPPSAFPNST